MSDTDLYDQLIACNKALFENGNYEAAYHLLCAAKHYASDRDDTRDLYAVLDLAHQQSDWINAHAPNNMLSLQSSSGRNRVNLYASLFEQLRGNIQIAESNRIMHNIGHHT
jgi:hypothetical protein